ncbi:MAG: toxin-antitoxin system TumE family protein [Candidatus Entotheonellia bacterium]
MTPKIEDYFDGVERLFLLSPVVLSFDVKEREERLQEGFIRVRAVLSNGDLIEAFEFVAARPDAIQTLTYRIHWQSGNGRLKRRWDNAPHHAEVPTFPHHVHLDTAEGVAPSESMRIVTALAFVEGEIERDERLPRGDS